MGSVVLALGLIAGEAEQAGAQALAAGSTFPTALGQDCSVMTPGACIARIGQDQPMLVRAGVAGVRRHWLLTAGLVAATAVTVHYDTRWSQSAKAGMPTLARLDDHADTTMIVAPFALSALGYVVGDVSGNAHLREAGIEAGEAMVDAALEGKVLKYGISRQANGGFWQSGQAHGAQMPSGHSLNIWAFAGAVAANYPERKVVWPLVAFASATAVARIASGAHYPGDVLVGSALGWGVGRTVAAARGGRQTRMSFSGSADRHGFAAGVEFQP